MMVKFKNKSPRNPEHFLALCYTYAKQNKEFREREDVMTLISSNGNVALFQCAYGFFLMKKVDKKVLFNTFFETKEEALKKYREG